MRKIFIADSACTDEALMEVADQNPLAALLWPWLLLSLDDWGRGSANPRQLRARLFPENPAVTVELIAEALELYAAAGLVIRYEVGGKQLRRRAAGAVVPLPDAYPRGEAHQGWLSLPRAA